MLVGWETHCFAIWKCKAETRSRRCDEVAVDYHLRVVVDSFEEDHDPLFAFQLPFKDTGEALKGAIFDKDLFPFSEFLFLYLRDAVCESVPDEVYQFILQGHDFAGEADYFLDTPRVLDHVIILDRVKLDEDITREEWFNLLCEACFLVFAEPNLWVQYIVMSRCQVVKSPLFILGLGVNDEPALHYLSPL